MMNKGLASSFILHPLNHSVLSTFSGCLSESGVLLFSNSMREYQFKPVQQAEKERPELSVFLPVFNEEENLGLLNARLTESLERLGRAYEIIYVDDGSTHRSPAPVRAA